MSIDYKVHPDFKHLEEELLHAHRYFRDSQQSIHKERNELRLVTIGDEQMVIKAFKTSSFLEMRSRDSKAQRSYENALRLMGLGVNTPQPVAFVDTYKGRALTKSYYISLFDTFDFTMRAVNYHDIDDHNKILNAFATFAYDLHQKDVLHTDNTPDNTLVLKEDGGYRFSLVDIHRVEFRPVTSLDGIKSFATLGSKDEDLRVMASEYARSCGLDERKTYELMRGYTKKVLLGRKIKAWLKASLSTQNS